MGKWVTLFSEEQCTMVSSWTTQIVCRARRGGACTLETDVSCVDVSDDEDGYFDYCSEPIKTKEQFLAAWQECCELMSVDPEVDDKVIAEVETICPKVAKALRAD